MPPELSQNGAGQGIISQIVFEPELLVGFDRVRALVLQFVGPQLVHQADAAALLQLVNDQAAAFARISRSAISSCARQSQRRL